ncbi:MAG: hypothetical protein ACFFD2_28520 [Promethearchaeota archaeon]
MLNRKRILYHHEIYILKLLFVIFRIHCPEIIAISIGLARNKNIFSR